MNVTLREITTRTFRECPQLVVAEDQTGFVATNVFSLAEATADDVSNPLAIYAGERRIGCVMYDFAPANAAAERPYLSLGFEPTGETVDGEIVVRTHVRA